MKHKGIICGILAAVCYGTNPFGALPLYEEGVNTSSVLFYRFSMAVLMLAVMLLVERKSFRINGSELKTLGSLGLLFAASSITYYQSFRFMDAGIASTILFVYPVMVAVIMAMFFREKVTASTVTAIILALTGIGSHANGHHGSPGALDRCSYRCDGVWRIAHLPTYHRHRAHPFGRTADSAGQEFSPAHYHPYHQRHRQKDLALEVVGMNPSLTSPAIRSKCRNSGGVGCRS